MLPRLSLFGGQNFRSYLLKFQPVSTITTSAAVSDNAGKTNNPPSSSYPPEYPLPTSKRDFVNFPRPIMKEASPPVRLGLIPESWFQFMYPKTGYTGPYVLGSTFLIYLISKEKIVFDHIMMHCLSFIAFCTFVHIKFGDKIGEMWNKSINDKIASVDGAQEKEKQDVRDEIARLESMSEMKSAVVEITKATTEIVHLQMELAFRERLIEVYQKVKNKLDCQAELENVERRIAQKNLMDYVLRNVMLSITPELEKSAMQLCVKDLNELAAKV